MQSFSTSYERQVLMGNFSRNFILHFLTILSSFFVFFFLDSSLPLSLLKSSLALKKILREYCFWRIRWFRIVSIWELVLAGTGGGAGNTGGVAGWIVPTGGQSPPTRRSPHDL